MKQTKIFLILFVAVGLLSGCKKFLNEQPQTEIGESEFWKSEDDIKTGLAAMYDGVQSIFDNNYTLWGDARTDEMDVNQYGDDAYAVNALSAGTTGTDWSNFYRTIQRANLGLKYIPIIKEQYQTGLDQKLVNHYMAQCYTTRALCYFWLIRLWGAVPVWTEPYEDISVNPNKERTAPQTIIDDLIIPDLQKAAEFSNPATNVVYEANIGATYALLMDVAMWTKDYAQAVQWYNKLTGLNKYALESTANWKSIFTTPASTKEAIWNLQWDWTVDGGADVSTLIGAGNTNSDFRAEDSVWNYFINTPADIRGPLTVDFKVTGHDKFPKFYAVNLNSSGSQIYPNGAEANILFPLYRWADIILLRAEAANKLTDPNTALTLLNQIRTRAGVPTYTLVQLDNPTKMENAILEERKLELYLEAKRWFDLVRTDKVAEVMDPYIKRRQQQRNSPELGFGDPRTILWPINRTVLNSNTAMSQNPPY